MEIDFSHANGHSGSNILRGVVAYVGHRGDSNRSSIDRIDDDSEVALMEIEPYLEHIGIDPERIGKPDIDAVERLQRAHLTSVPFENLSITGDPCGAYDGEPIELSLPHVYEKIIERRRGGYCFELNGLFHWLLEALGVEADRVAARVISSSDYPPPANHLTIVVAFDRRYIVDVGLGFPKIRCPLPLDGANPIDAGDVQWRVVESDRPDEDYLVEYREAEDRDWTGSYLFTDIPRDLDYFRATNDFLQTAPESPFTHGPRVSIATESGYVKCSGDTLTIIDDGETTDSAVSEEDWEETLMSRFGIRLDPP